MKLMSKSYRENSVNQLIKPFSGQWVALSADEQHVVGVGRTAHVALNKAQKQGERFPLLVKAPDTSTAAFIY